MFCGPFTHAFLFFDQVSDMENEVKFSEFAETGTYVTSISLEEFIKLYINHRPVFGICDELIHAFNVLGDFDSAGQLVLQKEALLKMLKEQGRSPCSIICATFSHFIMKPVFSTGEAMTEEEMLQCFTALLVFDEKEEEEKQSEESEQLPEHAVDTSDGISQIKTETNTLDITLKNRHNKYNIC